MSVLSVKHVATPEGGIQGPSLTQSLERLKRLREIVFQQREHNQERRLRDNEHRTAGILYYLELRLAQAITILRA